MARPLRIHVPGYPYHLCSRGNAKQCIFEDDRDCEQFLEFLGQSVTRFRVSCLAYCLLWNHFHLLVIPHEQTVSELMQYLNSTYAQWFNVRHKRVGHVLQGRFASKVVDNHAYLITALRYIARNPVTAERARRPEDWRWSSYRGVIGLEPAAPFLHLEPVWNAFNTADAAVGASRFRQFVDAGPSDEELGVELLFGGEGLARKAAPLLDPHRFNPDYLRRHRFAERPPLRNILCLDGSLPDREDAAKLAFCRYGYKLREIAEVVGRSTATVWVWIHRSRQRDDLPGASTWGQISIF